MGKPNPAALDYTPAWGFGAAPRWNDGAPEVRPGPGQYSVKTDSRTHGAFGDSPRYSISPRHERKLEQTSPGPIYSVPDIKHNAPAVFAKSPRDKAALVSLTAEEAKRSVAGQSPGPTAYDPQSVIGAHTPRFSFGSSQRSSPLKPAGSVGPGSYAQPPERAKGVVFTRSSRDAEMKKFITKDHVKALYGTASPGPGVYTVDAYSIGTKTSANTVRNSPRPVIGTTKRFSGPGSGLVPGPGAYTLPTPPSTAGAVKFGGLNDRAQSAPTTSGPGPGAYSAVAPGSAGSVFPSSPRWRQGTGPRFATQLMSSAPGPIYSPPADPRVSRTPAFSFGSSQKGTVYKDSTPMGPAYNVPSPPHGSPRWAFGTSPRPSIVNPNATPGAGSYKVPPTIGPDAADPTRGRGPAFRLATAERKTFSESDVPGPGTYAPASAIGTQAAPVYERPPNFKFGTAQRDGLPKGSTPGPGAYDQNLVISRPGP